MSYSRNDYKDQNYEPPQIGAIISPPDRTIVVVVAFLVIIGLMSIFSASAPKIMEQGLNPAKASQL